MYKPCVIIPVYNHPHVIRAMVHKIVDMGYPCILIDDGSDPECKNILFDLARESEQINLIRFDKNQGKGAAVCGGLWAAHKKGYSHALQIDADGQHDLKDIPLFFQTSMRSINDVITGSRVTDKIPLSRHYGRAITDILVWVHTLSLKISDSMCGFRVYPLKQTTELLDNVRVGKRMDFDTEILVRLYWSGLNISQLSTKVIYSRDIPSHFNMFADNIRMTLMHICLFFGMIVRIPKLIKRHF
ncbi:MAG: glycosyltransferase family 2 protein [Gammaproteobacteria bacterium]|nr:glycosyltransferase family 2 protein [Gammaproteobacteria bacterium]